MNSPLYKQNAPLCTHIQFKKLDRAGGLCLCSREFYSPPHKEVATSELQTASVPIQAAQTKSVSSGELER